MILIKNLSENRWKMINFNYGDGHKSIPRFHVVKGEPKRDSLLRGFLLRINLQKYQLLLPYPFKDNKKKFIDKKPMTCHWFFVLRRNIKD
jgi:hypothetical protein